MQQSLEGVNVLDLTHALAGPYCATMLADFGAQVFKLEAYGAGDIARAPCFAALQEFQRRWLELFRAVAARDASRMASHASRLIEATPELGADAREYLVLAAMAGSVASGDKSAALALWNAQKTQLRSPASPAFRLLRCHAEAASCEAEFRPYAEP